jgi:hypothetical protein
LITETKYINGFAAKAGGYKADEISFENLEDGSLWGNCGVPLYFLACLIYFVAFFDLHLKSKSIASFFFSLKYY